MHVKQVRLIGDSCMDPPKPPSPPLASHFITKANRAATLGVTAISHPTPQQLAVRGWACTPTDEELRLRVRGWGA